MNEQILKLVNQAQEYSCVEYAKKQTGYTREDLFNQKFAELIIDSCLYQCYSNGMNDELYAGQLRAADYIRNHFEVE